MDALFARRARDLVAAYFDVWILKLSGLFPSPAECAGCGAAAAAAGAAPRSTRRAPASSARSAGAARCSDCRRRARETLARFLSAPLDPAGGPPGLPEIAALARRARRHFLGHELKSQRVLSEVLG